VVSYILLILRLREHAKPIDLFLKFLDLITVTVPPGLPISMTFGVIFAL
jgi:magnesium-transporting ATPase (P-type)